jgi:hypothetical protein
MAIAEAASILVDAQFDADPGPTVDPIGLVRPGDQEDQRDARVLHHVLDAVDTIVADRPLEHRVPRPRRPAPVIIPDDLLAHVAPLGWEHIALTGDYIWNGSNPGTDFRPLREVRTAFLPQVA